MSMLYAVIHYPDIDAHHINQFRKKYDPQFDLIEPHITLVFPVPEFIGESNLTRHIETVLKNWSPFPIHLKSLQGSSDGYLFLLVQEGYVDINNLHTELYTGILAEYRRGDLPYVPHMTLGTFSGVADNYSEAFEEAEQLRLEFHCKLDRLHIVKINDERTQIVWSRECLLQG